MRSAGLLIVLAACGASASAGDDQHHAGADAAPGIDAAPAIDAPPPDALFPCTGGDARMQLADGRCFEVFLTPTKIRTDAVAACAGLGMHLAYVKTAADETVIAALAGANDVAIGLDDNAVEGQFVWGDGTPLGAFTAWHAGEPNNGGSGATYVENCAIYAGARANGGWDDRPCAPPPANSGSYGYACERGND